MSEATARELRKDRRSRERPPPEIWFEIAAARILFLIGALPMPSEVGGKKFVSDFKAMIHGEVAKALEEGRAVIRDATADLRKAIVEQSHGAARVIRQEARHIRAELGEYTGNNPPDEEADGKPDPTQGSGGGTGT
jgi:hypothetical protein